MNNLFIRSKLVFVAAIALLLAAIMPVSSAAALAQSPHEHGSGVHLAIRERSFDVFARSAATAHAATDQSRPVSAGPVIGLICAITASSVALGIAFGIRRRIDRIAGPDPDKADDD